MSDPGRCVAACEVQEGVFKRCIREAQHYGTRHLWVESFDRDDGAPIIVEWNGSNDVAQPTRIGDVHLREKK